MIPLAGILDRAGDSFGESLPRLLGAVLLVIVGLVVAAAIGATIRRSLVAVGFDRAAERYGAHDALARMGLERSLSGLVARAIRVALVVVVILAAVSILGLGALNEALNEAVLFLPKLFAALALVLIGFILSQFIDDWVRRITDQMGLSGPLPQLAQGAVLALFGLTALAQLGIPTQILTAIVGVLVVAGALTVALAFGLGGRDVARQISAGRSVRGTFRIGQRVTVGAVSGEIVAIESAATLVRADTGDTVRVPNQLLVESIVIVHGGGGEAPLP
ncbi:MAG: mechanosensitive ion channel [Actinobacteria bacterium]|nr:mechanosensitive ion channel [Actinomycetota bacterium]